MSDPLATGPDPEAPVVIGALGGSGTRVVGEVLIRAGVHLGGNLNTANDSVTATVLFNRPRWAQEASPGEVQEAFRTIRRFLLARDRGLVDWWRLFGAALRPGHTEGVRRRLRYTGRARRERGPGAAVAWGWKEPNSHLFLSDLHRVFPRLRFVYLMRHPLDMAFSANLNQLRNWGMRYGLAPTGDPQADARAQLDLWIAATDHVARTGRRLLGERLLVMRFDDLLEQPAEEITRLLAFVDVSVGDGTLGELVALPRRPSSHGRHEGADRSMFREDQLESARRLWGEL